MIKSPQHKLAKFLNALLHPVLIYYSIYVLYDSFQVVDRIKNLSATDTFLSSVVNVKKLFTDVPLDEIMKISTYRLCNLEKPTIKTENFVKLMKMATSEVQFSFNNIIYSQTDGVAMGSPLVPTLANIFMGHLEYNVVPSLSSQIFYIIYIDLGISKTEENNKTVFDK